MAEMPGPSPKVLPLEPGGPMELGVERVQILEPCTETLRSAVAPLRGLHLIHRESVVEDGNSLIF